MAGEVIKLAAVKEPHFVYMALGAMMVGVIAEVKLLLNTIEACQVTSLGLSPAAWRYIRKISGTRIAKFVSNCDISSSAHRPCLWKRNKMCWQCFPMHVSVIIMV